MRSGAWTIFDVGTDERIMLGRHRDRRRGNRPLHMELFGRERRNSVVLCIASDREWCVRPVEQYANRISSRFGSLFGGNRERRCWHRPLGLELQR